MAKQVDVVAMALGCLPEATEAPIRPVLAFVNAEWGLLASPLDIFGVLVIWPEELAKVVSRPGPLGSDRVQLIAKRLALKLKPA